MANVRETVKAAGVGDEIGVEKDGAALASGVRERGGPNGDLLLAFVGVLRDYSNIPSQPVTTNCRQNSEIITCHINQLLQHFDAQRFNSYEEANESSDTTSQSRYPLNTTQYCCAGLNVKQL